MLIKICPTLFHNYKAIESGSKFCIICGKKERMPLSVRFLMFRLTINCFLWERRGLQRCPHHGFNSQSWIDGYCKKCEKNEWTQEELNKSLIVEYF